MLRSFFLVSFRNLFSQKGFTLINVLGLTFGLSIGFMILLYIFNELSYDEFHDDHDRIYRIAVKGNMGEMNLNVAVTPAALGHNLIKDIPEIERFTCFEHVAGKQLLRADEKKFYDNHLVYADTNFLNIFSFRLINGDARGLSEPNSIILTEKLANKYFGTSDPVGETIILNNEDVLKVIGVIENLPEETHLAINALVSFETLLKKTSDNILENWSEMHYYTYIKLRPNVTREALEEKISDYLNIHLQSEEDEDINIRVHPYLQEISEIHLNSNLLGEIRPNSDYSYIYILSAIAFGILLIAGVNFMNLSTARSSKRAKEISIKKILGANRKQLILQFIGESVFLSLIAMILALAVIEMMLPLFNNITNKEISLMYLKNAPLLSFFLIITLILGIFSGSYPSLYLSGLKPIRIMKSHFKRGTREKLLRNILVFFQFTISSGLIVSTIVIYTQLDFVREKRLGFDRNNVISIFLRNEEIQTNAKVLKEKIENLDGVYSASLASSVPGMSISGASYFPEGFDKTPWLIYSFDVDENFIETTFRMNIIEGRNFSNEFPSDSNSIIINETLMKKLKWEEPLGKIIRNSIEDNTVNFKVIGVVRDFHFRSLHEEIEPTLFLFKRNSPGYLLARIKPENPDKTLQIIRQEWDEFNPELPFDYEFLNESFSSLYSSERKLGILLVYFSAFAIIIASLGLLGLAYYTAEQRTKEIGVRKVMGASIFSISKMLSLEYLKVILYANLIAWPFSYFLMQNWLKNFSYQTPFPYWSFLAAGVLVLLPALLVINFQTMRITAANPVNTLRYE